MTPLEAKIERAWQKFMAATDLDDILSAANEFKALHHQQTIEFAKLKESEGAARNP